MLLGFGLTTGIYAQTVTGLVTIDDGLLPGATILVQGTNTFSTTDFNGNFSIEASEGDTLVISYVGYATQEVLVSGGDQITVTLTIGNKLDEVVVTGYGSVTKRDAIGAVDVVDSESFDLISADSPAQILRGKVAGVQITSSSGEPGAGVSIRVRGNTSVRSGNEPLIVVDEVPLSGGNTQSGVRGFASLGEGSPMKSF